MQGIFSIFLALNLLGCGAGEPLNRRQQTLNGISLSSPLNNASCQKGYSLATAEPTWYLEHLQIPKTLSVQTIDYEVNESVEHVTFRYLHQDRPLCRTEGEAHRVRGEVIVRQAFAKDFAPTAVGNVWPSLASTFGRVVAELGDANEPISDSECWFMKNGKLHPAFDLALQIGGENYTVIASADEVFEFARANANVSGKADLYDSNPLTGRLASVELQTLLPGGIAASPTFRVKLPENRAAALADATGRFAVTPEMPEFREVSVFFNAEAYGNWVSRFSNELLCVPIEIHVDAEKSKEVKTSIKPSFNRLGAEYLQPNFSRDRQPKVLLGSGEGTSWTSLALDRDVIAHEIGHHLIFRKLRDLGTKETLELHEAIADFLVFAFTGNACLAESLCQDGAGPCTIQGECLRSAELAIKYKDAEYNAIPAGQGHHIRGQVISGMLWDLGKKIGRDKAAELVIRSIDYFSRSMSFQDFLAALKLADKELHRGSNDSAIKDAAAARGL